jgi:outer membrane protein assembly factor BamB
MLKEKTMKKSGLTISMMIISMILIVKTNVYSQDWPQFRGSNLDGKVTGFKAPQTWPKELTQVWKVNVGFGDSGPVLAGGKIYLLTRQGTDEVVLCLDASSGKELWKSTYPAVAVTGPSASAHPGPRSTPVVANGKLVTFGVSGILSCFDAGNGKLLWRKENPTNAIPRFFTGTSPIIVDGMCIVYVGKTNDGQVLALDINTGNEKWKWQGDGPTYSTPSMMTIDGKKHLVVQSEKNLMAFNLTDGKLLWQIATPVQGMNYNAPSPFIDGQTIIYSGSGTGSRAAKVEKQGDQFTTKELWTNAEVGAKWNTPVLKGGFLFGFTDQKRIYCLNEATGQTAWIDVAVNSDFSTLVDCGTVLISLTSTDNLIVFAPDGKEYKEIAKYKVSDTPIYAFPVIAGNNIYVKDTESITLFKIQ